MVRCSPSTVLPRIPAYMPSIWGMILFVILLIFHSPKVFSQKANNGYSFGEVDLTGAFGSETSFNTTDWLLNFHVGVGDKKNLWSGRIFLDFRPYEKVIWKKTEGTAHQYRSKRFLLGLTADKLILPIRADIFACGVYVEGKAGYSFGNYRGTATKPPQGIVGVPSGGIAFSWHNSTILKGGAEWYTQPNQTIDLWRAELGLMFMP